MSTLQVNSAIFAAELSTIYCVSLGVHRRGGTGVEVLETTRMTLGLGSEILMAFKGGMSDSGGFAVVFCILKDHLLRDRGILLPTLLLPRSVVASWVRTTPVPTCWLAVMVAMRSESVAADGGALSTSHVISPVEVDRMNWQQQRHHSRDGDLNVKQQQAGPQSLFDPAVDKAMIFCDGAPFSSIKLMA
ncbi:uncharacterized protein PgNI_07809 [Pyricularia grisea]|uniref:Uncharacterized protein n=1 Tax=Pyricularia grisea TaxID=148305 RepID=A0A6P8B094_PYRGI|nr:uncharacterized protein PgNI_07809 [Pyricularia grisea]TLD08249.1 hypothetical protein PgNI_07809 [Pyricularia grisea]